jgi:hypothetical protein
MFGRAKQEREEQERARRREKIYEERRDHWKMMMEGARDGHEETRFFIDNRLENLYDWLRDFDQRVAGEIREHARMTRMWLVCLTVLVAILVLDRLWR